MGNRPCSSHVGGTPGDPERVRVRLWISTPRQRWRSPVFLPFFCPVCQNASPRSCLPSGLRAGPGSGHSASFKWCPPRARDGPGRRRRTRVRSLPSAFPRARFEAGLDFGAPAGRAAGVNRPVDTGRSPNGSGLARSPAAPRIPPAAARSPGRALVVEHGCLQTSSRAGDAKERYAGPVFFPSTRSGTNLLLALSCLIDSP